LPTIHYMIVHLLEYVPPLLKGNVSMLLRRVRLEDEGYRAAECAVLRRTGRRRIIRAGKSVTDWTVLDHSSVPIAACPEGC